LATTFGKPRHLGILLEDFRRVNDRTSNHIRERTTRNMHSYLSHAARLEAFFRLQRRLRFLIDAEERDGSRYRRDYCRRYATVKPSEQGGLQFAFMTSVLRYVLRRLNTRDKSVERVYNKLDAQSRNGCSLQKLAMHLEQEASSLTKDISAASALEAEDIKQRHGSKRGSGLLYKRKLVSKD
jgi:hypothetical protein